MTSWTDKAYDLLDGGSGWASAKKKRLAVFGAYTIVFLIAFLIAYSPFIVGGGRHSYGR